MCYWAQTNPDQLHQRPLHSVKVTVCCAVSCRGMIGPYFFEDEEGSAVTVTSQRYVNTLETFLAPRLHSLHGSLWQQLDVCLGDRIISKNANIAWPPRSPDLSVCDYFLWGHLKSVVYQTRPTNLTQVKTQIEENIANIPVDTLRRPVQNLQHRLTECVRRSGQHLSDIFKK